MVPDSRGIAIAAVGDIFPGDHYFSLGHGMLSRTERGTLADLFADSKAVLQDSDLAICNLEGPLSQRSAQSRRAEASAFRGVPQFCDLLAGAGFTHVNVANNHITQHGSDAFHDTLQSLKDRNICVIGLADRSGNRISVPAISHVQGRTVCVVGYSSVPERYSSPPLPYAHFTDHGNVTAEITSLSREYDHVVVCCHAGDEGMSRPSRTLISMYRQFIDAGARCVFGHHPHAFQPIERYRDGLIAYSLGDFAFDLFWDRAANRTAILQARIASEGIDAHLVPMRFSRNYRVLKVSQRSGERFKRMFDGEVPVTTLTDDQYELLRGRYERTNRYRKAWYFLRNLLRGDTRLKLEFLIGKLSARF